MKSFMQHLHLNDLTQLAQLASDRFQTTEIDLPQSGISLILWTVGLATVFALSLWVSLRDTRFLSRGYRIALLALRLTALGLLVFVLLNPRLRTQTTQIQKSRIGVLIDTSSSMAFPAADKSTDQSTPSGEIPDRATAVKQAILDSNLLNDLSKTHTVSVFTFDSKLNGPVAIITDQQTNFATASTDENSASAANQNGTNGSTVVSLEDTSANDKQVSSEQQRARWDELLAPTGPETRLGESLNELIGQVAGRTLSGLVVLTDGGNNAGLDLAAAKLRAERSQTKLITVGTGSETPSMNLRLAGIQSPTSVHRGDPFDLSVTVQGSGITNQTGTVTLFQQSAAGQGNDRREILKQAFEIADDGLPVKVSFSQQITVPGEYEYVAVAKLDDESVEELSANDNQRLRAIEVTDRKMKVLVISSGPMRDYHFVRNTLYRHSGIESDVWLQTIQKKDLGFVSQEAKNLLTEFPKTESDLFEYDVIIAFDANWKLLSPQQQEYLNRWVDEHSGGIIFVAGELFTPEMAADPEQFRDINVLYPVILNRMLADLKVTQRSDKAWPIKLTLEGKASPFLKISDATGKESTDVWESFEGIYRSYPVRAIRDGATILARYGNPRARTQDGEPPFLASQFYGKGRTIFVSSAETWRLRAINSDGHQRFWTNLVREVGQGRRSRGQSRGLLLLDKPEMAPGQTLTVRAQLYDAQLQPLQRESVPISITDSSGKVMTTPNRLQPDSRRPGQYTTTFRPAAAGEYRLTIPVPESNDVLTESVLVSLPDLEAQNPAQDVKRLTSLTAETGGRYLSLDQAVATLPDLLPDRSEPLVIDEQLKTLWDRSWLMYLLIGLLCIEWALRKFLRLS